MRDFGDFEIVRELGRGGMGIVYEAIERSLERRVALKILHPDQVPTESTFKRFADEARKIAKLSHPSILKIHRFGEVDDTYFLVLEYVDGLPLDTILANGQLSIDRIITITLAVAGALSHAHKAGIIHRDIKPGNILMSKEDRIVLGDFGIAKDLRPNAPCFTTTGCIIGTPAYMSPEQAQGGRISAATDIYSLGVMAFEMITGRVPSLPKLNVRSNLSPRP